MSFNATNPNPNVSPPSSTSGAPEGSQNRRKHPCVLCQQRKVKCDRGDPCANCVKARVECVSPTTLPPRRRKKRFPEAELLARLRKYEDHLRRYGADIDAINSEGPTAGPPTNPTINPATKTSPLDTTPLKLEPVRSLSIRRSLKHVENNLWTGVNQEFRDAEELLEGSSDDEFFEKPITRTFDSIKSEGSDFIFPSPASDDLRDLHPSTVHIFRLWQKFLDSINPLIKIFHAPTVQQQVLDASADLDNIPKGVEALMFGIYCTAVTSFDDSECIATFGESKPTLLTRYHAGARQALQRAGLLRSSDITILQAFVLYIISCLNFTVDPRSLFCLTGIAVRIAQRMGLSFDGTSFGLPPFEVEMRRRLWWQILLFDTRVSELSGAGSSVLNHTWSTKLPLNVNDSDLYPDMRDPPTEHPGATEMIFVLQRCEVADVLQQLQNKHVPLSVKDEAIDELEKTLEQKYIQYCDPSIPLHLVTILMAKLGAAKLRMGPRHPHLIASAKDMPTEEKDFLFSLSLQCLENHTAMLDAPNLNRFFWFILTNFPFPAHVYLLCSLRYRTNDELADRAWNAFQHRFERQDVKFNNSGFLKRHQESAIHLALANLAIKAWEAREKALAVTQPGAPTPEFITRLRTQLAAKRPPKSASSSSVAAETTPPSVVTTEMPNQFAESYQWFNPGTVDPNQGFDLMPGLTTNDNQSIGWDLWNDLMQPTIPGYPYEGVGDPLAAPYSG